MSPRHENEPYTGLLFQKKSDNPKSPKFSGFIYTEAGEQVEVVAWLVTERDGTAKLTKNGAKMLSIKRNQEREKQADAEPANAAAGDLLDEMPF